MLKSVSDLMVYDIVCTFAYVIVYINRYYRRDDEFGDAAVTAMAAFFVSMSPKVVVPYIYAICRVMRLCRRCDADGYTSTAHR